MYRNITGTLTRFLLTTILLLSVAAPAAAWWENSYGKGWYMPIGLSAASSHIGGEASLAYLATDYPLWAGAYTDLMFSYTGGDWFFSIGPECGYAFFGIDFGYMLYYDEGDGRYYHGFSVRAFLTFFSILTPYVRLEFYRKDPAFEFGALVKYPIPL